MKNKEYKDAKVYHYTSTNKEKQANAAVLIGAYAIICLSMTAEEIWEKFELYRDNFKPF